MRTPRFWLNFISKAHEPLKPEGVASFTTTRIGHCAQMNAFAETKRTDSLSNRHFLHKNCRQMLHREDLAQASLQTTCPADKVDSIMISSAEQEDACMPAGHSGSDRTAIVC
jgi:hypothetical protein